MIFISQYCFANISATKTPIFIKFDNYNYKIVHTDPEAGIGFSECQKGLDGSL